MKKFPKEPVDILLADDDADEVVVFNSALRSLGFPFNLRHAENGDSLFLRLQEKIPYILFLDIRMPCEDGIACIVEIRKNRKYDKLPVIMYIPRICRTLRRKL